MFSMLLRVRSFWTLVWLSCQTMSLSGFWLEHIVQLWLGLSPSGYSWRGDPAWQAKRQKFTRPEIIYSKLSARVAFNTTMYYITITHFVTHFFHTIETVTQIQSLQLCFFPSLFLYVCMCVSTTPYSLSPWPTSNGTIALSLVVPNSFVWHVLVRLCPSVAPLGSKGNAAPPICVTFNSSQARQALLALMVRAWHRRTCLPTHEHT